MQSKVLVSLQFGANVAAAADAATAAAVMVVTVVINIDDNISAEEASCWFGATNVNGSNRSLGKTVWD